MGEVRVRVKSWSGNGAVFEFLLTSILSPDGERRFFFLGLAEGVANYALTELRWLKDSFIPSEVEENPSTHFIRSGFTLKDSP